MHRILALIPLASIALFVVAGCGRAPRSPAPVAGGEETQQTTGPAKPLPEDHGHKSGNHGGTIVPIGRDNYHAEAVIEKGGVFRLYLLGQDEARVLEIEQQPLTAYVKAEAGGEAIPVPLKAEPQAGDAAGKTSRFVGNLPAELRGKNVAVTIPSIRIKDERFRLGFSYAARPHEETMPETLAGTDEERKLFLAPGGRYTMADIKANGGVAASERYRDFRPAHDLKPRPGDKICPVTLTKANAQCTWVVGGQSYEFCCPPCIEEFVKLAKEQPEEVLRPDDYRKK